MKYRMQKRRTFFLPSLILISITLISLGFQRDSAWGQDYQTLSTRVKGFDRSVDFKVLRLSHTEIVEVKNFKWPW